ELLLLPLRQRVELLMTGNMQFVEQAIELVVVEARIETVEALHEHGGFERRQLELLRQQEDVRQERRLALARLVAQHGTTAALRKAQARHQLQQRALAGAVGAQQSTQGAGGQLQVQV